MIARLSSPLREMRDHYTVVVVGSGYGGAIAASRMARAGQDVCLFERGKELIPGEYPDSSAEALCELQADWPGGRRGPRTGLFDLRINPEMSVLVGCGLGGTSLINANVSLQAEPRVFEDACWPQGLRDDLETRLADGYRLAEAMLRPTPYPSDAPSLAKLEALEQAAGGVAGTFYRPPINVTFEDGPNQIGVEQHACRLCGDCASGCNYGAKNTVLMNYLPDAKAYGAEIYTQACVRYVEQDGDGWRVHVQALENDRKASDGSSLSVGADVVILGSGALGSAEILLRSKERGLSLSDRVGERFTGNGDVLGFAYNNDVPVNGVGFGARPPEGREPVGPCIAGIIDLRDQPLLDDGMVIEEGVIPGGLADQLAGAFATAGRMLGRDTDSGAADKRAELSRELDSLVKGPYHGAVRNTLTYLVMTHDDGRGRMVLENDRLRIDWPGLGAQATFRRVDEHLMAATGRLGGTYLHNPLWTKLTSKALVTVHPLGGCVMGEDAERGTVDDRGRVFAGPVGRAIHPGLYVSDGSVVPRSLGVNPLLTISALTERCCSLIAAEHGWEIDYAFGQRLAASAVPVTQARTGIEFTERMVGHLSTEPELGWEEAAIRGERDQSTLELDISIVSDDVDDLFESTEHPARIAAGTVTAPALSSSPLVVEGGTVTLFAPDPLRPDARRVRLEVATRSETGNVITFEGLKHYADDAGVDVWGDASTVFVTAYEGSTEAGRVLGKGIVRLPPVEFLRSMTSIRVTNAQSMEERLRHTARFGKFWAGSLFDVYGRVSARPTLVAPNAPPRKRRELRAPAPAAHACVTVDGVSLPLTRYEGGDRGPVVLAHGLGVSSSVFVDDTLDTSLVEYLVASRYDVWLLDWRSSTRLSVTAPFTCDDVARGDWPAAIRAVRELSGAESVAAVVHGTGSLTCLMAVLDGLEGVGSIVSLGGSIHPVLPEASRLRDPRHLEELANGHGVGAERAWQQLLRRARTGNKELCEEATCRRVAYMYGPMYEHDRLGVATHDALHEHFGTTRPALAAHVGRIAEAGHAVDAAGENVYLPHVDRLALPVAFVHGTADRIFLPEGSTRTLDILGARNGAELYSHHLVPGYGHLDLVIGRDAATDVYPLVVEQLERM